jgi:hypothetical protein
MTSSTERVSYPDLHMPVEEALPVPQASASAPVDPELQRIQAVCEKTCASCKKEWFSQTGSAFVVLSCQHKMHVSCFSASLAKKKPTDGVGGVKDCEHCVDAALRSGTSSSDNDPDLDLTACASEMYEKHRKQTSIDTEAIMRGGVTNEILFAIAGVSPPSLRKLPSMSSLYSLLTRKSEAAEGNEADALVDEVAEFASRLPRGDELVDYLNNQKPPRTLNMILKTFKVNLAHFVTVGINSIDQLKRIGFDVREHLDPIYRPVMPVYLLAQTFGLSYDEHLANVVTPAELSDMRLMKRELRLLGVTVAKLIATKKWNKDALLKLHVAPSQMIKYLGLEFAHLKILGFQASDFDREPLWQAEKTKDPQIRELVARLANDQKKK